MRGSPELLEAIGDCDRSRVGGVSNLVPSIGAAHKLQLAILAYNRLAATAAWRLFRLGADDVLPHRGSVVINRARGTFGVESWPRHGGIHVLADRKGGATPRILNRLQVCTTHGFRHSFESGLG